MKTQRMITKGDWKFISYPTAGVERLYNVKEDPYENDDLASNPEYSPQLSRLKVALTELNEEMNDPLSSPKKYPGKK